MQRTPVYIGIFAEDNKTANKDIRHYAISGLRQIVQTFENQDQKIHQDLNSFQNIFKPPADNYHITTLFTGGNIKKLNQKQIQQLDSFKSNQKTVIKMDCIVYIPGFIICAYCSNTDGIEADNKYPHVTLFLGNEAKAVESNMVIESLAKKNPQMFFKNQFKTGSYNIDYNKYKSVYVIGKGCEIKGVTGTNFSHGKK